MMALDLEDIVQKTIFFKQSWEPNLSRFLKKSLRDSDVFYDIGSNVGYYSLLAAKQDCTVVAIDPDPANIAVLKENIALNNFDKIRFKQIGLGEKNEDRLFFRSKRSNNGQSGFISRNPIASFKVNIYQLDNLIEHHNFPLPTVIKIDTEGWEEKVLIGAKKLLEHAPPRLIIFESEMDAKALNDKESIVNLLGEYHYAIIDTHLDDYGTNYVAQYLPSDESSK